MDTRQTLTPDERETTLTMSDGDDHVRINTAQRTSSPDCAASPKSSLKPRAGISALPSGPNLRALKTDSISVLRHAPSVK